MGTLAEQAVEAIHHVSGRHEGSRAAHAKGILAKGTFAATPQAAALTRAAHMQGEPVTVTARFSNGSGNPKNSDKARDGRGLAVKFYLPDGGRTDMVALTLPSFFVRRAEDFPKFTRATKPIGNTGLPGPKLMLYAATHPEAWRALRAGLALKPVPSYANCRFNGIHSFKWVDADGGERWVRYSWLPDAGEATLSGDELKGKDRDYLAAELGERLAREPVRFTLQLQLADPSDPIDDATAAWPDDRETVEAGTLELTELETGRETGDDILVFDPTRVTDGIETSDDPILHLRSQAYSVSVELRSGAKRPAALDA